MALEISIEEQGKLFLDHLHEEGNDRIIFSGAFGVGKTYFLNKFFTDLGSEYLTIRLSPINYSVSSNEDIFKLIKYDILLELILTHGLSLESEQISFGVAVGVMLPAKAESIMKGLLSVIALLNKDAEAIPTVLAAFTDWSLVLQEISKQRKAASQHTEAVDFGEDIIKMFQLETDDITSFLEDSLNKVTANKEYKQKVLIIDDLDRIDPEHAFRLFNIFSAHLDYNSTNKNKFGFDKVIFVCDIHNIRNIFHSSYGAETDFTGYIDKFYSKEIFLFNNRNEIRQAVNTLINSIVFDEEHKKYFQEHILKGDRDQNIGLLEIILTELIHNGSLTMRRIKHIYGTRYKLVNRTLYPISFGKRVWNWQVPALITLEILSKIMGGIDVLRRAIANFRLATSSESYIEFNRDNADWLVGVLLPIADYKNHQFRSVQHNDISTQLAFTIDNKLINYKLIEYGARHNFYYGLVINSEDKAIKERLDFFTTLTLAVDEMQKAGIIS